MSDQGRPGLTLKAGGGGKGRYTCADYRAEMILAGLNRRLNAEDLTTDEREALKARIRDLEAEMGLD